MAALYRKIEIAEIAVTLAFDPTKLPVRLAAAFWIHQGQKLVYLRRDRWRNRLRGPQAEFDPGAHGFESRSGLVRFDLTDVLQQRRRRCRSAQHCTMHAATKRRPNGTEHPCPMRADVDQSEVVPQGGVL